MPTMRTATAAAVSIVFFLIAPATIAGVIPWWLTRWQVAYASLIGRVMQVAGAIITIIGASVLVHAFARFVVEGRGTPAPVAPPARLVIGGLYRYVRNPMYLAVLVTILGQALLFGQRSLVLYAVVVGAAFELFVHAYEEPMLKSKFGADYEAYKRAVPRWWPRVRPWRPGP